MRHLALSLASLALLLSSCDEQSDAMPTVDCTPLLDSVEPAQGPADGGTEVTLRGLFVSSPHDTRDVLVRVGSVEATVDEVVHPDACEACDLCTAAALRCVDCERVCRGLVAYTDEDSGESFEPAACESEVRFTTAATDAPGAYPVSIVNVHGQATGLEFSYLESGDDDSAR